MESSMRELFLMQVWVDIVQPLFCFFFNALLFLTVTSFIKSSICLASSMRFVYYPSWFLYLLILCLCICRRRGMMLSGTFVLLYAIVLCICYVNVMEMKVGRKYHRDAKHLEGNWFFWCGIWFCSLALGDIDRWD